MEPITREWLAGPNLDRMYEAAVKLVKQVLKDAEVGRTALSAHVQGSFMVCCHDVAGLQSLTHPAAKLAVRPVHL